MGTPESPSHGYTLLKNHLGGGGYADVWEATDRLGRPRAVKLIRKSMGSSGFIEAQARALARIDHKNVVRVHDVVDLADPTTGEVSLGIVMDMVDGPKLSVALKSGVSLADAKRIGLGIVEGVEAIHAKGLFHADLHDENIIVGDPEVIIIDILYTKSAAELSTAPRESRRLTDLQDVWRLLRSILFAASAEPSKIAEFDRKKTDGGLLGLRAEFLAALERDTASASAKAIATAKARFTDRAFVKGPDYAKAVVDVIPIEAAADTLLELLQEGALRGEHRQALRLLFERMPSPARQRVANKLAERLDAEVPGGNWILPILLLASTAKDSWPLLPTLTVIRLESALIEDVKRGHRNIHNPLSGNLGALGTWSASLWRQMRNPGALCDAIIVQLHSGWFGQNYIAESFFHVLPALAKQVGKEAEVIAALRSAYANDAHVVKSNLKDLPADWQTQIKGP